MHRRVPPIIRFLLGALAASALMLALGASPASAHAYLEGSSPAAGTNLATSPSTVAMRFDETLNKPLSRAALYDSRTGKPIAASVDIPAPLELVLRPGRALARGSYRVEWHTVSTEDGHEIEGSFSFGVQAAAVGGSAAHTRSPLTGLGWLRVLVRTAMYAALFLFTGALMLRTLLGARGADLWVLPATVRSQLTPDEADAVVRRERSIVIDAGLLAVALAAASAMIDMQLAAGSISSSSVHAFLLSNTTGVARVGLVALLAVAVTGATMAPRLGGVAAALALGELALSGHADSATPRAAALVVDWLHLVAGAVWLGGIAIIVLLWLPRLRTGNAALRRAIAGDLLVRFGRVALPAFLLVVTSGLINAYIQIRHPALLWNTAYGRALLVKSALVATIALTSYKHAYRVRARLLAPATERDAALERRHRRLIGSEPLLGIALAATVALLVSFATPGQIAAQHALAAQPVAACDPCALPLPAANELSVAGHAATNLVAAWLRRRSGHLTGQVRVLAIDGKPASTPFEIADASAVSVSCGLACRRFTLPAATAILKVIMNPDRNPQTVSLPTQWQPDASAQARAILLRSQAAMRRLASVRETELVNSVPGLYARDDYTLNAPDRISYQAHAVHPPQPGRFEGQTIAIGAKTWFRSPGAAWQIQPPAGTLPFATPSWFAWSDYAQTTRLIETRVDHGRRVATIVLMDPGAPVWWTLHIDLAATRVISGSMITPGHFATQTFSHFNDGPPIRPPAPQR